MELSKAYSDKAAFKGRQFFFSRTYAGYIYSIEFGKISFHTSAASARIHQINFSLLKAMFFFN